MASPRNYYIFFGRQRNQEQNNEHGAFPHPKLMEKSPVYIFAEVPNHSAFEKLLPKLSCLSMRASFQAFEIRAGSNDVREEETAMDQNWYSHNFHDGCNTLDAIDSLTTFRHCSMAR